MVKNYAMFSHFPAFLAVKNLVVLIKTILFYVQHWCQYLVYITLALHTVREGEFFPCIMHECRNWGHFCKNWSCYRSGV